MTKLINGKEIFESLPVSEQTVLLKNLVDYVGGAREVNLKALGYSQHCGAQRIDKKITDMSVSLICQSMTGIFQKEIRL